MTANNSIIILDLRGLNCPLPVLKTQKAMRSMVVGEKVWVETTDPLSAIDIPNFCTNDGHVLEETQEVDGFQRYLIEKGAS